MIGAKAQFRYKFTSLPDSSEVKLNGEIKCHTPCRLKFYWKEAIDDKLVFSVSHPNYKSWSDTIRKKPRDFDQSNRIELEPKIKPLEIDENSPLIAFDKLMVRFSDGKKLGEKVKLDGSSESINWRGSIKIGDEVFEKKFYELMTNMGYNSVISENAKLFSEERRRNNKLPRFIVGVEIVDYKLNYRQVKDKNYGDGDVIGNTKIKFNWNVLDKKTGDIVLKYENNASVRFRQELYQRLEYSVDVYKLALVDFLQSDQFYDLISKEKIEPIEFESNSSPSNSHEIINPIIPSFNNISEMISYANQACVTIVTDGGHGSGVIIDQSGLVLTAYHVVEGVNQIDIKFSSGLSLRAEIIEFDKFNDIALLKIQGEGFKSLPLLTDENEASLGTEVITIGTPAEIELGQSIARGIISGKRKIEERIYLQTDISISPGNSGGPLLNSKGEILGIIQKKIVGDAIEGIGFAVPTQKVMEVLNLISSEN